MISSRQNPGNGGEEPQPKKVPIDQKVTAKNALPFLRWAPWLLVLSIIGFILEPTLRSLGYLWPVAVVTGGITAFMVYLKKTGKTFAEVSSSMPFIGKIVNATVTIAVLGSIILLIRWAVNVYMVDGFGISPRHSYMVTLGAAPFILAGIWKIFSGSLPGKPGSIFAGSFVIALALISVLYFIDRRSPEGLVDHKTGTPIKWVSPDTRDKRVYSSDGVDTFGNKLIPAVEAVKNGKSPNDLIGNKDEEMWRWDFTILWNNPKNYNAKMLQKRKLTAVVTRTLTQLVVKCYQGLTEVTVLQGTSKDGKIYTGTWRDNQGIRGSSGGVFHLEFTTDGAALGTITVLPGEKILTVEMEKVFLNK